MVMGSPQPTLNLDPVLMSSPGVPSAANLRDQLTSASPSSMPTPGSSSDPSARTQLPAGSGEQDAASLQQNEQADPATVSDGKEEEGEGEEDEELMTMTQGAADCEFYDPAALEIESPADGRSVHDEELLSRVGSEENYSTRPAPSSMAAQSVTFSLAGCSDMGDSFSVRDLDIAEIPPASPHSLEAWRAAGGQVVRGDSPLAPGEKQDEREEQGIVMSSTPPPRFGYDHGTEPIQTYETRKISPSITRVPADILEQEKQRGDCQRAPAFQDAPRSEASEEATVTEANVEKALMDHENERMRLSSTKIKGLVGVFFTILFWCGLYIGLNFAPK